MGGQENLFENSDVNDGSQTTAWKSGGMHLPGRGNRICEGTDPEDGVRSAHSSVLTGRTGVQAGIRGGSGPRRAWWGVWVHSRSHGGAEEEHTEPRSGVCGHWGGAGHSFQRPAAAAAAPSEATSLGPLSLWSGGPGERQLIRRLCGLKNSVHFL